MDPVPLIGHSHTDSKSAGPTNGAATNPKPDATSDASPTAKTAARQLSYAQAAIARSGVQPPLQNPSTGPSLVKALTPGAQGMQTLRHGTAVGPSRARETSRSASQSPDLATGPLPLASEAGVAPSVDAPHLAMASAGAQDLPTRETGENGEDSRLPSNPKTISNLWGNPTNYHATPPRQVAKPYPGSSPGNPNPKQALSTPSVETSVKAAATPPRAPVLPPTSAASPSGPTPKEEADGWRSANPQRKSIPPRAQGTPPRHPPRRDAKPGGDGVGAQWGGVPRGEGALPRGPRVGSPAPAGKPRGSSPAAARKPRRAPGTPVTTPEAAKPLGPALNFEVEQPPPLTLDPSKPRWADLVKGQQGQTSRDSSPAPSQPGSNASSAQPSPDQASPLGLPEQAMGTGGASEPPREGDGAAAGGEEGKDAGSWTPVAKTKTKKTPTRQKRPQKGDTPPGAPPLPTRGKRPHESPPISGMCTPQEDDSPRPSAAAGKKARDGERRITVPPGSPRAVHAVPWPFASKPPSPSSQQPLPPRGDPDAKPYAGTFGVANMTREFSQGLGQGNEQVPGVLTAPRPAAPATVAMPPEVMTPLTLPQAPRSAPNSFSPPRRATGLGPFGMTAPSPTPPPAPPVHFVEPLPVYNPNAPQQLAPVLPQVVSGGSPGDPFGGVPGVTPGNPNGGLLHVTPPITQPLGPVGAPVQAGNLPAGVRHIPTSVPLPGNVQPFGVSAPAAAVSGPPNPFGAKQPAESHLQGVTVNPYGGVPPHHGAMPGVQGLTPGHHSLMPGHQGSMPGHQGLTPGHQGLMPGHQGLTPGHQGSTPGHQGPTPGHVGHADYRTAAANPLGRDPSGTPEGGGSPAPHQFGGVQPFGGSRRAVPVPGSGGAGPPRSPVVNPWGLPPPQAPVQSQLRADAPAFVPTTFAAPTYSGPYPSSRPPIAPPLAQQAATLPLAGNGAVPPAPAWVRVNRENGVRTRSPAPAAPQTPPGYASVVAAAGADSGSDGAAEDDRIGQGKRQTTRTPVLTQPTAGMPLPSPVGARARESADWASRTASLREVFEGQAGPAAGLAAGGTTAGPAGKRGIVDGHVPSMPGSVSNPVGDGQTAGTANSRRHRNMRQSEDVEEISAARDGDVGAGRIIATASSGLHADAVANASRLAGEGGSSSAIVDANSTSDGSIGAMDVSASPLESARRSLRASLDGEDGLGVSIYEQLAHSLDPSANQSLGLEVGLPSTHLRHALPGRRTGRGVRSSLREPGRYINIVTTASLPWRTGTAVNPLLRAAYLAEALPESHVALLVPWLSLGEQKLLYPDGISFAQPDDQEKWIREWVQKRMGSSPAFKITFYCGRYDNAFKSIFPVGDLTNYIPDDEADIAVLEEPEHLTWFHHGRRWTSVFDHVVGIMHTNYVDYVRRISRVASKAVAVATRRMCSIHCHKVIKLSDAVQRLPRQSTVFVHGVSSAFLDIGDQLVQAPRPRYSAGAYYLGKALWGKGYSELLELMSWQADAANHAGPPVHVDVYGNGEDLEEIKEMATARKLPITFHPGKDHLDPELKQYRVFVNPSTSDVVATTSAEALAMGKWLLCPEHPSNAFFSTFHNTLIYRTPQEFCRMLQRAKDEDPHPLNPEEYKRLTWQDATQRFLDAAEMAPSDWPSRLAGIRDRLTWHMINTGLGMEPVRRVVGAGRNTLRSPKDLANYIPGTRNRVVDHVSYHLAQGYPEPRII